jgi:tRNA threonylcarbamoyladenosine biosynthesis protein TsaB
MVILAIETVTRAGSVALVDGAAVHAKAGDPSTTHAERLPLDAIDWLTAHGRRLDEVDVLAVVTGPGSFTGLRVGIAAVQGLALAGQRRALGIPTLEAIAGSWQPPIPEPVVTVACLDGQRGDVFFAAWLRRSDEPFVPDRPLIAPTVGSPRDVLGAVAAVRGVHAVALLGDAAMRAREVWRDLNSLDVGTATETLAEMAARIATSRVHEAGAPHALRPVYLRRPDAELARARRHP